MPYKGRANELLGYPADARLLILNADDFGMCHAVNEAVLRTLREGLACSTTLMTPCPWARHAMHLLADHPKLDFGVHLTAICEGVDYRWGPLTCRDKVPSLVDETGCFYSLERRDEFLEGAKLDELETEFRAQIEMVLATELAPTHLDWHCLHNGGRGDIFDLTLGLGREYGLALRVSGQPWAEQVQSQGLPANDHEMPDSFRLEIAGKSARYAQMLRELRPGLTEWAIHPGYDNAELRAVQPDGNLVRQTDYDFLMSQEARDVIREEGIILVNYRALQAVWNAR